MNGAPVPGLDAATLHDASGLSNEQAAARLQADGPNEIPQEKRGGILTVAREVLREPMFRLLLAAGVVYVILGDIGEALMLLVFATASVGITIYQSYRAERALDRLRDLSSPRALVIRDGRPHRIAGREVVRGDRILVGEGDRVPADLLIVEAQDLQVDESTLTGESLPVVKRAAITGSPDPAPDDAHLLSGTLVVRGSATAVAYATGAASQLGRLGFMLMAVRREPTSVHLQTRRLVRLFATFGLVASVAMVLLHGLLLGQWMNGVLSAIALAMALLPEEFPLVLTVFFALGAWRMAQRHVLARHPAAIEALGATTVLCSDKTGTLTENRMKVAAVSCGGQRHMAGSAWPVQTAELLLHAALATKQQPVDPMDRALQSCGFAPQAGATRVHEYPFRPDLPLFAVAWSEPGAPGTVRIAVKGAPETVARLCRLDENALHRIQEEIGGLAAGGLRVLGVAGVTQTEAPPEDARDLRPRWLGLVAFADPLRPTVAPAIAECHAAGIAVRMITGDHPATAAVIAHQAGIDSGSVVTGAELEAMSDRTLRERIAQVSVFARINPQQKLRIVEALKSNGEVVAMTGDGVNDAPALKAAHIGVAMGGRGTDVARESSSLVLLDDDFSSLVAAVRHGRRIYDNLRKAVGFIVAVHVPIAGLAILPLLLGWPPLLHPIHIVFLELIIDPVCSIVFEAQAEEPDIMSRPPRDPQEHMFRRQEIVRSLVLGAAALGAVACIFHTALAWPLDAEVARSMAFAALVSSNFGLVFAMRRAGRGHEARNGALWRTLAIAASVLACVLFIPPLRALFGFGVPPLHALALALLAGPALLLAVRAALLGAMTLRPIARLVRGAGAPHRP